MQRGGTYITSTTWEDVELLLGEKHYRQTGISIWVDWVDMEVEIEWEAEEPRTWDYPGHPGNAYVNRVVKIVDFALIDMNGNPIDLPNCREEIENEILNSVQLDEWLETQGDFANETIAKIYDDYWFNDYI